ncbi:2124_t:CDS:2, partial [Entrophospora sp. SA101]
MSPRTNSPPPSLYEIYDDTTNDFGYHPPPFTHGLNHTTNNVNRNNRDVRGNININGGANSNNTNNDNDEGGILRPFNIPRRIFSSTTAQFFSLIMIYSFCITVLWIIFCTSFLLTFYDDTCRIFLTSRVWGRVKNGVRERIAMMGEDWEDFFQNLFDQLSNLEDWLSTLFRFRVVVAGQGLYGDVKRIRKN